MIRHPRFEELQEIIDQLQQLQIAPTTTPAMRPKITAAIKTARKELTALQGLTPSAESPR